MRRTTILLAASALALGMVGLAPPAGATPTRTVTLGAGAWLDTADEDTGAEIHYSANAYTSGRGTAAYVEIRRVDVTPAACGGEDQVFTELVGPGALVVRPASMAATVTITGEVTRWAKPACGEAEVESLGSMTATLTLAPYGPVTTLKKHDFNNTPSVMQWRTSESSVWRQAVGTLHWGTQTVSGMRGEVTRTAFREVFDLGRLSAAMVSDRGSGVIGMADDWAYAEHSEESDATPAPGVVLAASTVVMGGMTEDGPRVLVSRAVWRWVDCGDRLGQSMSETLGQASGSTVFDGKTMSATLSATVPLSRREFDGCTGEMSELGSAGTVRASASVAGYGRATHYVGVMQERVRGESMNRVQWVDWTSMASGTVEVDGESQDTTYAYVTVGDVRRMTTGGGAS